MNTHDTKKGFMLASVLVISFAIIAVMTSLLVVASNAYKDSGVNYYQKLADEAAEAGASYATACLNLSDHAQTWGPAISRNDLVPSSDCSGATNYPDNTYVYSDATVRSYFAVGDLDYTTPFSAQISARGYTEVMSKSGSISKTYTSIQKKVLTWPTDTVGQMSASGTNRTCAIVSYSVYCWGWNGYGQLGNGMYVGPPSNIEAASAVDSTVPVKVSQEPGVMAGKRIVKIFVAQYHSCALSQDGLMYCWGNNNAGQLGTGNATDSAVPVQVKGALLGKTITDIGGTSNTTCAVAGGKFYCWGQNNLGQVGINSTTFSIPNPTLVVASNTASTLPTSYSATALSSSGSRSQTMCGIANGKAYCWGQNDFGAVGDGTPGGTRLVPTKVDDTGVLSGKTVTSLSQDGYVSTGSGGFAHVCAIANSRVYCWGDNQSGQLGNGASGTNNYSASPVETTWTGVLSGKVAEDIQVGLRHSCVKASGGVYCWGMNTSGQLGEGSGTNKSTPVAVQTAPGALSATNVTTIGAGANRGCATITDGRTFCWGLNSNGQIGDGTKITRSIPTESLFLRPSGNAYIF